MSKRVDKFDAFLFNFVVVIDTRRENSTVLDMTETSSSIKEEIEIRQPDESDANALALLLAERGFDYPTEVLLVRQRLSDLIRAGDCILVAVYNSKVIGMALLHRTHFLHRPPDGRIVSLVISEAYRNRGIGGILIAAAESVFRKWGCGRIEVSSGAKREAAHRFYIRAGYTEQPKRFIKLL